MTSTPSRPQATTPKRASKMASNQSLNLNHLLNFTLPPRQSPQTQSLPRRSRKTNPQVWNKERFVNAQYRFVMNPAGDYTVHFADPDIFFQWQDVLQVIVPRTSALASAATGDERNVQEERHAVCPICLSPPVAPRMAKCGHVFCFPCILHYLNTSDNKWARCPLCLDSVNETQLKSVRWFDGPLQTEIDLDDFRNLTSSSVVDNPFVATPREGSFMQMRLMQRPQITTLALPRSVTWPSDLLPPHQAPFHFLPDVYTYAKFMLATPPYLIEHLRKDLDELANERCVLTSLYDELGLVFVESAEGKVKHQIAKAAALETPQLKATVEKANQDQRDIQYRSAYHERRIQEPAASIPPSDVPGELLSSKSAGYIAHPSQSPTPESRTPSSTPTPSSIRNTPRQRRNINPPPPSTSTYYFYQAASGFPIFLHPLDIKILVSHFSGYSSFPDTITIRIEAVAEGTVNDDLRKRCKYLAHMPEGADVVFVEADLEGVVGREGIRNFEALLRKRRTRRKEKGRKDDKAKAKAEERERERLEGEAARLRQARQPQEQTDQFLSPITDSILPDDGPSPSLPPAAPVRGAWGARSFASALHSSSSQGGRSASSAARREQELVEQDEWDLDVAWHELERNAGGRKKRGNRLLVLGGGGRKR